MRHLTEANRKVLSARGASLDPAGTIMAALAGGAEGAGGGRPIAWASPDESLSLYAEAADAAVVVRLRSTCGSEVRLRIGAGGTASVRVIDCGGEGYKLTPDGLVKVTVTGGGTEDETETESDPMSTITITGCVDGVDRSITVFGYVNP